MEHDTIVAVWLFKSLKSYFLQTYACLGQHLHFAANNLKLHLRMTRVFKYLIEKILRAILAIPKKCLFTNFPQKDNDQAK